MALNSTTETLRIAILEVDHQQPYGFKGGDAAVHSDIKRVFEEVGHTVHIISVKYKTSTWIRKFTGVRFNGRHIGRLIADFDLVICDSIISYYVKHPRCINLFHYSFAAFRDVLGWYRKPWNLFFYTLSAYKQKKGSLGKYVVAVSDYLRDRLKSYKINTDAVIVNAVDTRFFFPEDQSGEKKCLYAGMYAYYAKGFDILHKMAEKGLHIDCLTQKNPAGKLNWIKSVPRHQMPSIYRQYKFLVYPSRSENMQMVPLEAMACGLPVIISNVGLGPTLRKHIPEFVITEEGNQAADAYLKAMEHIEKDYFNYREKALNYVKKNHSFEKFSQEWLILAEKIFQRPRMTL